RCNSPRPPTQATPIRRILIPLTLIRIRSIPTVIMEGSWPRQSRLASAAGGAAGGGAAAGGDGAVVVGGGAAAAGTTDRDQSARSRVFRYFHQSHRRRRPLSRQMPAQHGGSRPCAR